jgi:hypothetical protein
MKLLFFPTVVALSACAVVSPTRQHTPDGMSASSTSGTVTITGDELKQTGRTDLPDALRASSTIFH